LPYQISEHNKSAKQKSTSAGMIQKFMSKAHNHSTFETTRDWLVFVHKEFEITHDTRIYRVNHHQFDTNDIYCVLEVTQPLLQKESWTSMSTAIFAMEASNPTSHIFIDNSLVGKIAVFKLSDEATTSMAIDHLIDELNSLRQALIYDFSSHFQKSISAAKGLPKGPYIVPQRRTQSSDESEVVKSALHARLLQQASKAVTPDSFEILRHTTAAGIAELFTSSASALRKLGPQKLRSMSQINVLDRL